LAVAQRAVGGGGGGATAFVFSIFGLAAFGVAGAATGCFGAGAATGGGGDTAVAGGGGGGDGAAAAAGGGGGAALAAGGDGGAAAAGGGVTALTALPQAGDSLAICCRRQSSASLPPRGTPEQFDKKSERQEERMALNCSSLGFCACAGDPRQINAVAIRAATAPHFDLKVQIICPARFWELLRRSRIPRWTLQTTAARRRRPLIHMDMHRRQCLVPENGQLC
jgi:hypothetical protein